MEPQGLMPSSTSHSPYKQQKYGHRHSLLTEVLAYSTACTPAGGRHQLHFLPNEQGTSSSSQQNLDRCNRRQNSRWMGWRALKIYLITSEEGFTKVQFRKSTNDRAKP
jgi:hypothetical protein